MRRNSLFWGTILLLGGILLLLDNMNLLPVRVWDLLWPTLLVMLGIWILVGSLTTRRSPEDEHVVISMEGAAKANLRLNHGAGRIRLRSGDSLEELVEGDFGGGLDVRTSRQGDELDVEMSVPTRNYPMWPWGWNRQGMNWNMAVNRGIPLRVDIKTGANEADLDFTDLQVSEIRMSTGASSSRLSLPASAGYTRVYIEAGAASVSLRVPENVAARIRSHGGLSSTSVDRERFPRTESGVYQSGGYETAPNKVEIEIQSGVGSVDVR